MENERQPPLPANNTNLPLPASYVNAAIEKLQDGGNYPSWKVTMRAVLVLEGLWPQILSDDAAAGDPQRDERALARISLAVHPSCHQYVCNAKTARLAWLKLAEIFENQGLFRRVLLLRQLHRVEMAQHASMSDYINHVTTLVQQLANIDKQIDDAEVAEILLSGLPKEFDVLVSSLETACLTSKLTSDLVRTRLLQEEIRQNGTNGSRDTVSAFISKKTIKCNYCHRMGHIARKCFKKKRDAKKDDGSNAAGHVLYASAMTASSRDIDFVVDSGATSHMCRDNDLCVAAALNSSCQEQKLCPPQFTCCEQGCCLVGSPTPRRDINDSVRDYTYPWYAQWSVLFLLGTLGGILLCCIWCLFFKKSSHGVYMCSFACCVRRSTSDHDSAGSIYPPPRYSRCGSFRQAPPPYSEVTSKPDLYPLVITCGEGEAKNGGNYLMVHYFRNYVIRAPGSLSATSTAESLNSSFICNAANEANSVIPPPYSCASNYEDCVGIGCGRSLLRSLSSLTEPRENRPPPLPPRSRTAPDHTPTRREPPAAFRENLITSPVQPLDPAFDLELELIDCEMYCDGGCKPRLGASPPAHRSPSNVDESMYEREAYGLRHLFTCPSPEASGACESPPQPTSPTQTSRESTLRRPSDERRHRRIESVKKTPKSRKSSLYMPLSLAYPVRSSRTSPGARASSRSAPATPCGALVPNLLNFTQRVSASRVGSRSSRFDEESDPLLLDNEQSRADHKF